MNPELDSYFIDGCGRCSHFATPECKVNLWKDGLVQLRRIVLDCGLSEEKKWHHPTYTHGSKNIVLIHSFKDYYGISFMKGSLLKDPEKILTQPTENMQAGRQIRFTTAKEVVDQEATIKAYIYEAIEVEKAGLEVKFKDTSEFEVPEELDWIFNEDPEYKAAFEALTPGRQRGYLLHFNQPKQSKTRTSRIEKAREKVFSGRGYNERY